MAERALVHARNLWDVASSDPGGVPLEIAKVIAWVHWCRYRALGTTEGDEDLQAAMSLVAAIVELERDVVPQELLDFFDEYDAATDPQAQAQAAIELLSGSNGDSSILPRAIRMLASAVGKLPEDDPNLPHYLSYLSDTRQKLFKRDNNRAELDRALANDRRAVELTPEGSTELSRYLILLSLTLQSLFEHGDSLSHLDEAVEIGRKAVAATPPDDPELTTYMSILGLALRSRIGVTGTDDDIDEAIALASLALRRTSPGDPDLGERWSVLARAAWEKAMRSGALEDVDATLVAARNAVAATTPDHRDVSGRLADLAEVLVERFLHLGQLTDLDEAVTTARAAVGTARVDDPALDKMLSILSSALWRRFGHSGSLTDLDDAVDVMRRAVGIVEGDGGWLSNLGAVLRLRYQRTGNVADLDEAVTAIRGALEAVPPTHQEHAAVLANLGGALRMRFDERGEPTDLNDAITACRGAVAATDPEDPSFPAMLTNLGSLLQTRFARLGALDDINEAIAMALQATDVMPETHPGLAGVFGNLAAALHLRHTTTGEARDLEHAVATWTRAATMTTAPTIARLKAARGRAEAIADAEGPASAVAAYADAVRLLPLLLWREVSRDDQQYPMETVAAAIARDAAACAIEAGDGALAVEMLEQGRGITWSHLLGTRTDLTMLRHAYPDVAADLAACRAVLDGVGNDDEESRLWAAQEFDVLAARVRGLPRTADLPDPARFLHPPRLEDLLPRKGNDRIVLLNVSSWRCDALVLSHDGVTVVPLPTLTVDTVRDAAGRYLGALQEFEGTHGSSADRLVLEHGISDVLEWLWDHVAEPVLSALGHTSTPTGNWPRLWWCPTGALTVLPLHAAGYHGTAGRSVLDRVVSSYATTARSLARPRTRPAATGMLVVALPETPGRRRLPGTEDEQHLLAELFEKPTVLADAGATREAVSAELVEHDWFHASCHGTQSLRNPLAGGLLPYDWETEGLVGIDVLTDHPGGEFAFLSACTTATTGIANLDEVVAIASAMHQSGWRHVVATLWTVWDDAALAVSRALYPLLVRHGYPDASGTARALHRVTRELRDRDPDRPSTWAPFVHAGA
ncbi:CHAT domain-containing protein [Actinophytocola oryzae]|uniref:CHAT domain-containing protein n=1 Tax=Actinophytocola oryzae TaxID=502181 RepID=UPI0010626775|nr:CHAT domain-containing protein [Actinophytocola oryzae]